MPVISTKTGVREENPIAIVGYDDTLVERLEDGFHLGEPSGLVYPWKCLLRRHENATSNDGMSVAVVGRG